MLLLLLRIAKGRIATGRMMILTCSPSPELLLLVSPEMTWP